MERKKWNRGEAIRNPFLSLIFERHTQKKKTKKHAHTKHTRTHTQLAISLVCFCYVLDVFWSANTMTATVHPRDYLRSDGLHTKDGRTLLRLYKKKEGGRAYFSSNFFLIPSFLPKGPSTPLVASHGH